VTAGTWIKQQIPHPLKKRGFGMTRLGGLIRVIDKIDSHKIGMKASKLETKSKAKSKTAPFDVRHPLLARTLGWCFRYDCFNVE